MADVQIDNGNFTRISNEILDNMAKIKLSPTQYRLLFVVWRYTYGFQRKEHDLSLSFLGDATGCDKRQIQRELKKMEERNIIKQNIKSGSYRKISFNKNYDLWITTIGETTIGETTIGETTIGETVNSRVGENVKATIGETTNQERNKENFKEKEEEDALKTFDENICISSPIVQEQLIDWCNEKGDGYVIASIKLAADHGANSFAYVKKILNEWHQQNLKTVDQVRNYEMNKKRQKAQTIPFKKKASGDIDWETI